MYVVPVAIGRLITASCTTGWLNWIHGELWLLPNGLLWVRSGLLTTMGHGVVRTVSGEPAEREFSDSDMDAIAARGKRGHLWIPADQIKRADLHTGLMTSRASLWMLDGRKIKLLWLRGDRAERPLSGALTSWNVEVSGARA